MILSCGFDDDYPPDLGDKELARTLSAIEPEELDSVEIYGNEWSPGVEGELLSSCENQFLEALSDLRSFRNRPQGQSVIMFGAKTILESGVMYETQVVSYTGDPQQWFVAVFHHDDYGSLFKGDNLVSWSRSLRIDCISLESASASVPSVPGQTIPTILE